MKRFVGYLSISLAILTGVLVGFVPSLLSINGDGDFTSSNRFVFKISEKQLDADFSGGTGENSMDNIQNANGETPMEEVTNIFKERLSLAEISSYELESYSNNTFALTFKDNDRAYDDIVSYLTFSNSFMIKDAAEEYNLGYSIDDVYNNNTSTEATRLFVEDSATVQYRDGYPYVVVQLANPSSFKEMVDGINASNEESSSDSSTASNAAYFKDGNKVSRVDDVETDTTTGDSTTGDTSGDGTTEENTKIDPNNVVFLVNNWLNGLNLQNLLDNENGNITDDNFHNYVITYFDVTNPQSFYWDYDASLSSTDQEAATYEYLYFGNYNLSAINGDTGLDVTTSYQVYNSTEADERLAYKKANLFAERFNSSDLKYNVTLINQSQVDEGSNLVSPFVEYIKRAGSVELSTVLICTIIAVVIVSLFLLLNYGLPGLLSLVVTGVNLVSATYLFSFLGNQFNLGTILGLFAVAALSILGTTLWLHRAKEDLYLGKNLKKAYQDANKKTLLNLLDFTVVGAIIALVAYLIPNSYTSSFGGVLLIGTLISVLTIGIVFRAVNWLLYNSQFASDHIKLFGIEKKMVPDLSKGEKPTYFDAFKKRSSKNTFKVTGIIAGVLLLASIVGITTFQVMNGDIYNSGSNETNSKITVSYVLRNANDDYNLNGTIVGIQTAFSEIYADETHEAPVFSGEMDVNAFYYEYLSGETSPITNREYYFIIDLGRVYDAASENDTVYYYFDGQNISTPLNLADVITTAIQSNIGENYNVSLSSAYDYTDDLINMYIAIASSISVAIIFAYFLLRFGPSKAVTSLLVGASSLTIVVGIFSLLRGPFPSEITLGLLLLTLLAYLIFDIFFTNERLAYLDNKHEIKDIAAREELYDYSGNSIYNYVVINMMFIAFIVLSFFFTPAFDSYTLILILVGIFLLVIFIKALELPLQIAFVKAFDKVKGSLEQRREATKSKKKNKTRDNDEGPQEAIFIGIND